MFTPKRLLALAIAACVLACTSAAFAQTGSTDELLKLVPSDWPIIVRTDATPATASGAYLQKTYSDPEMKNLAESMNIGLAKLISSIGIEIPVQAKMIPWMSKQSVIAVNPPIKGGEPQVLCVVASTDAEGAEKWLTDAAGSLLRNSEPVVTNVGSAKVFVWDIPGEEFKPAYAIGNGFVAFADSIKTLQTAMSGANAMPAAAEGLKFHADDLVAFSVDTTTLFEGLGKEAGGGESGMAMMAAGVNPHGGFSISDKGFTLKVQGQAPLPMAVMIAPMLGSKASSGNLASNIPSNALAAMTLASGQLVVPFQEQLKEVVEEISDLKAAVALAQALPGSSIGVGVMGFIPRPSIVAVAVADDTASAAAGLDKFRAALQKAGLRLAGTRGTSPTLYELKDKKDKIAGYIGQTASTVFYGSDFRSATRAAGVTEGTSLASRPAFADMQALNAGPRMVDMWVSLDGISALGYLYQGVGAEAFPLTKWIADSLKSTNGLGVSAGMNEQGVEVRMSMRTEVGPGTAIMGAYTGLIAGMAGAQFPIFRRAKTAAQGSQSLSNLKQLALAAIMYTDDYDGAFPDPAKVKSVLMPYVKAEEVFQSPFSGYEYKMNPSLKGLKMSQIAEPAKTILFYEINIDKAQTGTWESPDGCCRIAYVDGHVLAMASAPSAADMKPKLSGPVPKKPAAKKK